MTHAFRALAALGLLLAGLATPAAAAALSERPSTLVFSGTADYSVLPDIGLALALGDLDGGLLFEASGLFDPDTMGENPSDVSLFVTDADFNVVLDAIDLAEFEIGAGFLALLLTDVLGAAADQFPGGVLAILRDPAFPALEGRATVELRSLDDLGVIPLPATAPLLFAGVLALALARRRRD
jgi:hypothetical protein